MKTEFDVTDKAWKIYRLMYKDNLSENFEIEFNCIDYD